MTSLDHVCIAFGLVAFCMDLRVKPGGNKVLNTAQDIRLSVEGGKLLLSAVDGGAAYSPGQMLELL